MSLGRQWDRRLQIWDEAFKSNLYRKTGTLELEGFTTMEQLGLEAAMQNTYSPFPEQTQWGRKWEYGWFRCSLVLPREVEGKRVMLHLGPAEEMLVYINGQEAGSIDKQHDLVQLTCCAVPGSCYEIYAEAYAGHGPRYEHGGIFPPERIPVPEPPEFQCVVTESSYGVWNEEMFQAYADYHTLYELWRALPETSLRGMKIAEALKEFTYRADFELPEPERTESICKARPVLLPLLQAENGSSAPVFTVFGQSHLDLAWLWTNEETKRKSARTYANQLALMERYPEYSFLMCVPPILENLKKYYPGLFERVKEKAKKGQFIPEGAMWVEGDTNMAGGESLIRQFVLGKRWFEKEFGADSQVAWMPDTFGFSGALPQIMKGCRVPYFATQKLVRSDPECEQFPYNLFWWEGIDGSKVLAHVYKENNAVFSPAAMIERWEKDRRQQENIDGMIFSFGYGDGGGGPTELMAEVLRRCGNLEGAPVCRVESPAEYFRRALKLSDGDREGTLTDPIENVYYGELYLAWHRGTYTAQARIKKGVRKAEASLHQAEFLAGLLNLQGRLGEESKEALDGLWKKLLFCEFHDILPGSSIRRVNEEAEADLAWVEKESRQMAEALLQELAGSGAVFNSLGWERNYEGIRIPSCGYVLRDPKEEAPEETAAESRETGEMAGAAAKSRETGETVFAQRKEPGQAAEWKGSLRFEVLAPETEAKEGFAVQVENACYRAKVDRRGRIVSLVEKSSGYEYASEPLNELHLYQDVNIYYDAWEIGRMYEQAPEKLTGNCSLEVRREKEGLVLAIDRKERNFTWYQEIVFAPDSSEILFRTEADWHERHKLLKVSFPTSVYTKEAVEEIQFGYLKRPTHRSRQFEKDLYETCHHRYAALSDGRNGFALLNDCKYGISAKDSTLSLTILRAPVLPDMEADQGQHSFTYGLSLFEGPFTESDVVRKASELNIPVTEAAGRHGAEDSTASEAAQRAGTARTGGANPAGQKESFFAVDRKDILVETCKPALDVKNAAVLRLYECMGSAVCGRLTVPSLVKRVWICNMLEEKQGEAALKEGTVELDFHAFEIKTLLLETD